MESKNNGNGGVVGIAHRVRAGIDRLEQMLVRRMNAGGVDIDDGQDAGFLPNFCNGWTVFNVVVIAEILAMVISIVSPQLPIGQNRFSKLLMISLFIQWIALASAGALCLSRKYLNRLPELRALVMAYLMLLCVTWLVGEATLWVLWLVHLTGSPSPEWNAYFHVQNLTIAAIVNALALRYFLARHRLKQRTLSEARAKVQALRSRIRPHFLFNTMNVIASLTRSAPSQAESAIENMADIFRTMIADGENLVPIKNEIVIAQKYLDIESLRLDNRLKVDWDVGKFPRKAVIPVLTLQPLLEHAIQCGIEPLAEGGSIGLRLWEESETINIMVSSPLPRGRSRPTHGQDESTLNDLRLRLESHYGKSARMEVANGEDRLMVAVTLPTRGDNL